MGAYMYPIIIKKEPQLIRYDKNIEMEDSIFTLAILRQYVNEDESFCIIETDEGLYSKTILSVTGKRLENEDEVKNRVEREEKYMQKYNEFQSKKSKIKQDENK